ncbi:MAG: hypothetical protein O3B31_10565 [Chloroflexi bacterium]|nr:hypothetical protein [Chloroflexota bacterium]MDA1003770.1 hypothetical protein [Chloroflexota bacterium]
MTVRPGHDASNERRLYAVGEVSERAELLNGFLQLALDGEVSAGDDGEARWRCASSLSWRLGRSGEVELGEGDLALEDGEMELFAVLEHGTAIPDPDTGSAFVRATFTVDGARGDWAVAGDRVLCELTIDSEDWRGEIHIRPA